MRTRTASERRLAHVLSGEGFLEPLSVPELGRHLRWGDELVPGGTLTAGALALGVVFGKAGAAPAWGIHADVRDLVLGVS